jgi:hypothetical protein
MSENQIVLTINSDGGQIYWRENYLERKEKTRPDKNLEYASLPGIQVHQRIIFISRQYLKIYFLHREHFNEISWRVSTRQGIFFSVKSNRDKNLTDQNTVRYSTKVSFSLTLKY